MTPTDLIALARKSLEGTTRKPWGSIHISDHDVVTYMDENTGKHIRVASSPSSNNANFIATAPDYLVKLADALEAALARLALAEAVCEGVAIPEVLRSAALRLEALERVLASARATSFCTDYRIVTSDGKWDARMEVCGQCANCNLHEAIRAAEGT